MSACPSDDRLELWVNEQLPASEQTELALHIEVCTRCQSALELLTNSTLTSETPPIDAWLSPLLQRLKETGPAAGSPSMRAENTPVVPGYDLIETVGTGGMGIVYRARQHGVNREVAVKLLNRAASDREDAARFRREGEALGRLQHPNIVHVYEVGVADSVPFLVMELVSGGTLSELADSRPLQPMIAAQLMEQVARAVQHAHDHGVLHRDLKPSNILLAGRKESESGIPKVADFGIAKQIDQDSTITQTGVAIGTPSYMAPEQVASDPLTSACDVYGLGAVLYELLTGRPPFIGANAADVLLQVRDQEPFPPSHLTPTLPRDLNTICLKCLAKDPNRRYLSAWAMAEDLRRWRAGEPILARPAGSVERAWKWARRRKAAAALIVVAAFLLVVGLPTVTGLWLWAKESGRQTAVAYEKSERAVYAGHISQAEQFFRTNDVLRARAHLQACEPPPGQPDRRGWEWYYLHGLAYGEHLELPCPVPPEEDPDRGIFAISFDEDDRYLVGGSGVLGYRKHLGTEPGELYLWDAASGELIGGSARRSQYTATAVAFASTGRRIYAMGTDLRWFKLGALQALDLDSGKFSYTLQGPPPLRRKGGIPRRPTLAVSSDGSQAAVGDAVGITIYDTRNWKPAFDVPGAGAAMFTEDGKTLLTLDATAGRVTIRNPITGEASDAHEVRIYGAGNARTFSRSGKLLAWAVAEGDIDVVRLEGKKPEPSRIRTGHAGEVMDIAIDRSDRLLATAGSDGTVRVWDLESSRPGPIFRGHGNRVAAVAFDRNATRLASAGWGPEAKVWDLTRQPEFASVGIKPAPGPRRVEDFSFTDDGRELLAIRIPAGELERWDQTTGKRKEPPIKLDLPSAAADLVFRGRVAAFSAGGRRLAGVSGKNSRTVNVWDTSAGSEPLALNGPKGSVGYVSMSADGSRVAATSSSHPDGDLVVWDAVRGTRLLQFALSGETCSALALSADGRLLAAASGGPGIDHRVRIWEVEANRELHSLPCGKETRSVTFDGTGKRVAAATAGRMLLIWDARNGTTLRTIECLEEYSQLAFAPDGRRLAGATREVLTIWDPAEGDEVLTLRGQPRSGLDPPFNPRIAFGARGLRLAASQADNTVTVWTAAGYPGK